MSTNGDIEIAVKAEGADDAADELGGEGVGGEGATGQGEDVQAQVDTDKLSNSIKGGIIGGLIAGALGPVLDTLDPILKVLRAFLAPVSVMLLRLLAPFLRFAVRQLPGWFRFTQQVFASVGAKLTFLQGLFSDAKDFLGDILGHTIGLVTGVNRLQTRAVGRLSSIRDTLLSLPEDIWALMAGLPMMTWQQFSDDITSLTSDISNLPGDIGAFITDLPADIGNAIARRLPGGEVINGGDGGENGLFGQAAGAARETAERGRDTIINLTGGLDSFVDEAASSTDVDLF